MGSSRSHIGHVAALRARHHLRRRPERVGQVKHRGRLLLGHGRAGGQDAARRARWRTSSSPARASAILGRAEVTLTIDNSDGALPIDYAEVTISRLLFRSGQSEYAINGDHCRLLDVQELLSDTGLGREMHVIVGQGQLDEVLNSKPRGPSCADQKRPRACPEAPQAARKRLLRKLEAMQVNLTRLVDLTGELGQAAQAGARPPGRDRPPGGRSSRLTSRDARLRLLADDYVTVAAELDHDQSDEAAAMARRAALERSLAAAREREAELDLAAQQHAPRLAAAQQAWFALSGLTERLRGVLGLATERHRHLSAPPEPQRPGRDPDELDREAAGLREQEAALGERLAAARELLAAAVKERTGAEAGLIETDRRLAEDARSAVARALNGSPGCCAARSRPPRAPQPRQPTRRQAAWRRPTRAGPGPRRARPAAECAGRGSDAKPRQGQVGPDGGATSRPSPRSPGRPRTSPPAARPSTPPVTGGPPWVRAHRRWWWRSGAVRMHPGCCWPEAAGSAGLSARSPRC